MKTIELNQLPQNVQESVKSDLYMYDKSNVTLENGMYTTSPHSVLTASAKADDFAVFTLTRDDVYTKEEQAANRTKFLEETKNMDWEWFGQ